MRTMRNTFLLALLSTLILMTVCSCNTRKGAADNLLARIDSLADVNPDSADILLSRSPLLRAGGVRGGSDKARLLLRIKTDDKLYRPVTHYRDTILQLIDYFEHHPKVLPSLLGSTGPALPYLYAGRIFADLGDAPQALDYYQQALDVQPDIPSSIGKSSEELSLAKQRGLLHSFIGTIFIYQNLYDEAITNMHKANYWAGICKDTLDIIFNLRDIAEQYKLLGINDSSLFYYEKSLELANISKNVGMQNELMAQLSSLYIRQGNYRLAKLYIQPSLENVDSDDITSIYCIASKIYKHAGHNDSALIWAHPTNA